MIHPIRQRLLRLLSVLVMLLPVAAAADNGRIEYQEENLSRRLVSLAGREPAVLQFELVASDSGRFLVMECQEPFAVFREGMVLISSVRKARWRTDSLRGIYGMPLQLSVVRQKRAPVSVKFQIPVQKDPLDPGLRARARWREFAVLGGAAVIIYLIILMASSIRNMRDYLNFSRAFTTGTREDRPSDAGLTATSGLLIYGFFILVVSYTLTLYLSPVAGHINFSNVLISWLGRTVIIAIFLAGKLVMVSFFTFLYRIPEAANLQVTGMIRSGLFLCLLLLVILVPALMMDPQGAARLTMLTWVWAMVQTAHTITLYVRLRKATGARPFHLFSYLCISELIPLVYLVTTL